MGNDWLAKEIYIAKDENDEILNLGKRYQLKNLTSDWSLWINDVKKNETEVYARERIFLIQNKDSIELRWPDGLNKGDVAYFVEDVNGKRNWIPQITFENDALNSFKSLVRMEVKHNFVPSQLTIIPKDGPKSIKKSYSGSGTIRLNKHQLNHLKYSFESKEEQLAVFSEMYYRPGWTAFIDGKEVDYLRVNYVLIGVVVPAGKHTIEFKIKEDTYKKGLTIAKISSWILILLLLGTAIWDLKSHFTKNE